VTSGNDDNGRDKRRRAKNLVVALTLGAFVIITFLTTIVRLGQQN